MTVISQQNVTQLKPIRLVFEFEYDYDADKYVLRQTAIADIKYLNAGGQERATSSASLTTPSALLAAIQNAWDTRLAQYLGEGGDGYGLTIYEPPQPIE